MTWRWVTHTHTDRVGTCRGVDVNESIPGWLRPKIASPAPHDCRGPAQPGTHQLRGTCELGCYWDQTWGDRGHIEESCASLLIRLLGFFFFFSTTLVILSQGVVLGKGAGRWGSLALRTLSRAPFSPPLSPCSVVLLPVLNFVATG